MKSMDTFASSLTRAIGRQYDLFQTSLELVGKSQKFLNYGSGEIGYLIFIKSALTEETSVNLRQFRSTDPKFPQTPSSDQFFTEAQFEAYRELGWFIGNDMLSSDDEFVEGQLDQLVRDGAVPTGPVPPEVESATNSDGTKKFGASA